MKLKTAAALSAGLYLLAACGAETAAPTPRPTPITSRPDKAVVVTLVNKELPELVSLGTFTVYSYCPCAYCCGQWSGGPTASGTMPEEGRTVQEGQFLLCREAEDRPIRLESAQGARLMTAVIYTR